jgi:MOSC domain-containing protein YiiM
MQSASIFQINLGSGMPKTGVPKAEVTPQGLAGDGHTRTYHGGVERAVCLFSLERILALQAEGHPIYPGATGENITLTGLPWEQVTPGLKLRLGNDVLIEISTFDQNACPRIQRFFSDGDVSRMVHVLNPGWARMYARVLQPGRIFIADRVSIVGEPPPALPKRARAVPQPGAVPDADCGIET